MTTLKLLSAVLFASAVIAAPAMARDRHMTRQSNDDAYAADQAPYGYAPDAAYAGYGWSGSYNYRCVPAPRVGQFAGQPWNGPDVPCEPGTGPTY
jgi:hypothetical protein